MTILLFSILFMYTILIGSLVFGFAKMKKEKTDFVTPKTSFTIIVTFRNEGKNLPNLLNTLSLLDYPTHLFEVILVDDDSDEEFQTSSSEFQVLVVKNQRKSNSPKKDAIETAIKIAKHNWILTTDADCLVQKEWLNSLDTYIQKSNKKMISAGVCYIPENGFLPAFQNLDFLSLQGATIGSFGIDKPFMCNGANFAYQKDFFNHLNGFEGNNSIASGDDVFLLQKAIIENADFVGFLYDKRSIVATKSVDSWGALFQQRVRWASKSTGYSSVFGKIVALIVFLTNLSFVVASILWLTQFHNQRNFMLFFALKFLIDWILLTQASTYFKSRLKWVLLSALLYPYFSCTIAFYALLGNYTWKGRTFKK